MVRRKPKRKSKRKPKSKPKSKSKPPKPKARKRKRKKDPKGDAPPPKRPRKRGPQSYREGKKLFHRAGYEAKLRYEVDTGKSDSAGQLYRYGYKMWWRVMPEEKLLSMGIPRLNSFSKSNGHDGEIWGWKRECTMTNKKAGEIMLECIRSRQLTLPMLGVVRKSLAYSYQLMGYDVTGKQNNWPEVGRAWKAITDEKCKPKRSTLPKKIPTPHELKKLFTSRWDARKNTMSFLRSIIARRAAHDILLCGNRPNEDIKRLKESRKHVINEADGWFCTSYERGRSKLSGPKKNTRKWKQYALCWCEGGRHRAPTLWDRYNIGSDGNPVRKPRFDERCILAGFQFTNLWYPKKRWRRYPNVKVDGVLGDTNIGEPIHLALEWAYDNGVGLPEDPFSTNSGRKALAGLCDHLNVVYEESFEIHSDKFSTWEGSYQPGCIRRSEDFTRVDQCDTVDVTTRALRRFTQWFGLGARKPVQQLTLHEMQMDFWMRAQGFTKQADQMLLGLYATPTPKPEPAVKPEKVEPNA